MPAAVSTMPLRAAAGSHGRTRRGLATGVVLIVALSALAGCAASGPVARTTDDPALYRGSWAYAQACGLEHSARLDIAPGADGSVVGEWSDGTRVAGDSGRLSGRIRDGRLDLRLCSAAADCPPPSVPADAHLRREGALLVWYRRFGGAAGGSGPGARDVPYLRLHPVAGDADPPLDTDCGEAAEPMP